MLSSTCPRRVNKQQVFKKFLRALSTTPTLSNVKPLALDTDGHLGSAGTVDNSSFVQNIAAEWDGAKPFSAIPGPTRFQMFRGFMRGGEFERLSIIDLVKVCRQKYGDTCLIPGSFGMPPMLSVFDPVDIERVHRTEGKYPVRPGAEAIVYYRERRKDGFFSETTGLAAGGNKDWAKFRSAVNPVLMKPQNARLYLEPMMRVNHEFLQRIREIRDTVTHEVPGNFIEDINRLTFESVAVVALDKNLGLLHRNANTAEAELLFKNMRIFMKSLYDLGIKPSLYKYVRTPTYRRFEKAMDTIFDISKKYTDEALERLQENGEGRSVLEKLLKIDRNVATIMAMDMLMAGVEPTSTTLTGAMLLLAKNPVKQTKLRAEIQNAISKEGRFTIENMSNLPYLRACIKEAIRIYPITAGNFREAGMDIVLGGYRVPKGTRCIMNSNLLLLEECHFPRAKEFIPERWMRGDSERLVGENMNPFVYLPFGFGPRTCVGKRIVDLELELTLASLVQNFNIEFNYPTENAFECHFINIPAIPLKFKFSDL